MTEGPESLLIRKPKTLELTQVRGNLVAAVPSVAKAGLRAFLKQGDKAAEAMVEAFGAAGLKVVQTPGERAWLLVSRALMMAASRAALPTLMKDWNGTERDWSDRMAELGLSVVAAVDTQLQDQKYLLSNELIDNPKALPGLESASEVVAQWLMQEQWVKETEAREAGQRLPVLYLYALMDAWVARSADYEPVEKALKVSLSKAVTREMDWARYRRHLEAELAKPLFGSKEAFGREITLEEVYVPLRAYFLKRSAGMARYEQSEQKNVVWLEEELDRWLADPKASSTKVIGGGPGAGKSSFLRRYAARVSRFGLRPVVLVELHLADVDGDLPNLLRSYLAESNLFSQDIMDDALGERNVLIILDGLDELESSGRSGQEAARTLLRTVHDYTALQRKNSVIKNDVRILVSGREVVISSVLEELKQPDLVLYLLPYLVSNQGKFIDVDSILLVDQRIEWWSSFCYLTHQVKGMPGRIDEITSEPLLNYLVALAQASGKLTFTSSMNLNLVYDALVRDVRERAWGGEDGHRHVEVNDEEFFAVLEEVAMASWHEGGRSTTVKQIQARCEAARLLPVLHRFAGKAEDGSTRLLVAFFFRERGRNEEFERTFEFTHKSFAEYLIARRLRLAIETIHLKREQRKQAAVRMEEGWDERTALLYWVSLCGPQLLEHNAATFLYREASLFDPIAKSNYQRDLSDLFSGSISAGGMPVESANVPGGRFVDMLRYARNSEASMLVAIAACAGRVGTTQIHWTNDASPSHMLCSMSVAGAAYALILQFGLRSMNLRNSDLLGLDFSNANLVRADLSGANLYRSDLKSATLAGAVLVAAHLEGVNLYSVSLVQASLESAILNRAILEKADLRNSILRNASMIEAKLMNVDLTRANLSGAHLIGADLRQANLSMANLRDANLTHADLSESNLQGANLRGAILHNVKFDRASLPGVDLGGAHLNGARLNGAHLNGAHLNGAFYSVDTTWPFGIDPIARGALLVEQEASPVAD